MQYENPRPREGINYSNEHPLKEFLQLVVGVVIVCSLLVWLLTLAAGFLARYIPFAYEQRMVDDLPYLTVEESPEQRQLQALADRLSSHMQLPNDMQIRVHYKPDVIVNAFATLGGHVVIFQGLLEQIESEQELAAVMAHEIAHIKLRHPIVASGKGITLATLAAVISGASASSAGDWLLGTSISLQMMTFSRAQELAADRWSARALQHEYGDISGALALFKTFARLEQDALGSSLSVEAFRSHPYSENRRVALIDHAENEGWSVTGKTIPFTLNRD